jgi:ATP-dependent DNA ligase
MSFWMARPRGTWIVEWLTTVFDVLWLNGRSLMELPLDSRRATLKDFKLKPPLAHVLEVKGDKPWSTLALRDGKA